MYLSESLSRMLSDWSSRLNKLALKTSYHNSRSLETNNEPDKMELGIVVSSIQRNDHLHFMKENNTHHLFQTSSQL